MCGELTGNSVKTEKNKSSSGRVDPIKRLWRNTEDLNEMGP